MRVRKKKKAMTVVIGSSRLGAMIASKASHDGFYSSIIDVDESAFKKLDVGYSGFTVVGDATNQSTLEKAHIQDATEVVISTNDDNTNIFLASMIAALYEVKNIIVRLRDDNKAVLLNDERISIISTTSLSFQAYKAIKAQEE